MIYKSDDIYQILETINKIGKIFRREINYTKEFCKENFIYISDAIDYKDITINFLGALGEEFRQYGIYSIIEKKSEDITVNNEAFTLPLPKNVVANLLTIFSLLKIKIFINLKK